MTDLLRAMAGELLRAVEQVNTTFDAAIAYGQDIAAFAKRVFGIDLWEKQAEIGRAIVSSPRVAVKSGHRVGKSTFLAVAAWWWPFTNPRGRVICSSTTDRQVRGVIWKEIRRLWRNRLPEFSDLPKPAKLPNIGVQWEDGREILGFTAREPEAMAGYAGPELLFLIDEASGVGNALFDAIEGNLAGGGRIALFGNPTQQSGYFYDAFHRNRADWHLFTISSTESPNCAAGRVLIPGLATLEWCQQRERAWGKDSSRYQVRVKGNFPDQGDDAVVPRVLVEQGQMAWEGMDPGSPNVLYAAIDVARYGDDEIIIGFREAMKILELEARQKLDNVEVAQEFLRLAHNRRNGRRVVVRVDIGGPGSGVADYLRHLNLEWLVVIDVEAGSSASNPTEYANLRAEMAFSVRAFLEQGGALPDDEELDFELGAIKYKMNGKDQILIESKEELRSADRLGRSPDRADCVAMLTLGFEDDFVATGNEVWELEAGGYRMPDRAH